MTEVRDGNKGRANAWQSSRCKHSLWKYANPNSTYASLVLASDTLRFIHGSLFQKFLGGPVLLGAAYKRWETPIGSLVAFKDSRGVFEVLLARWTDQILHSPLLPIKVLKSIAKIILLLSDESGMSEPINRSDNATHHYIPAGDRFVEVLTQLLRLRKITFNRQALLPLR